MTQRQAKRVLANTLFVLAVLGTAVFGFIAPNTPVSAEGTLVERATQIGRLEPDGVSR
ncbi:MAG: hypothetical protein ACKVQT_30260 [Burkholderiales bacterium]